MTECELCGSETPTPRSRFCSPCKLLRRKEVLGRYNHSVKNQQNQGRYRTTTGYKTSQDKYHATEKCAITTRAGQIKRYHADPSKSLAQSARYYQTNRDVLRAKYVARRRAIKVRAVKLYGGKCVCCDEDRACFLTFDHVNNDGVKHRKEIRTVDIVMWIHRNGYQRDARLQLLCYNCNFAKQHDPDGHCAAHANASAVHGNRKAA